MTDKTIDAEAYEPAMAFYYKDAGDLIKTKIVFYFPFYTIFLYFLLNKSDYVTSANWLIKTSCVLTFCFGVAYAFIVVRLLNRLESTRLMFAINKLTKGETFREMSEKERQKWKKRSLSVINDTGGERLGFGITMTLLYYTASIVLVDIYFGKTDWAGRLIHWTTHH